MRPRLDTVTEAESVIASREPSTSGFRDGDEARLCGINFFKNFRIIDGRSSLDMVMRVKCKPIIDNRIRVTVVTYSPSPTSMPSSAKGIARLTVHIPSSFRQNPAKVPYDVGVSPSRWSTIEFRCYFMAALFVIPVMIWIPMSLSLRKLRSYVKAKKVY